MDFKTIYEAAKNCDLKTLENALCIDVQSLTITLSGTAYVETPASKLAREQDRTAVELLSKYGANPNWIAYGFAIAGFDVKNDQNFKYEVDINYIAFGFAIGGHKKLAEQYRKLHNANINWLAEGYAIAGHLEQVLIYLEHHGANPGVITKGLAQSNRVTELTFYFKNPLKYSNSIAEGIGLNGNQITIDRYKKNFPTEVLEIMVRAAARLNHSDIFQDIKRINPEAIIRGLASGGHIEELKTYLEQINDDRQWNMIPAVAFGFAEQNQTTCFKKYCLPIQSRIKRKLADLLAQHACEDLLQACCSSNSYGYQTEKILAIIQESLAQAGQFKLLQEYDKEHKDYQVNIAKGLQHSLLFSNKKIALHTLTFLNTDRKVQYLRYLKKYNLKFSYDIYVVAARAEVMKELMQNYQLNYDQALAYTHGQVYLMIRHYKQLPLPAEILVRIIKNILPVSTKDVFRLIPIIELRPLVIHLKKYSKQWIFGKYKKNSKQLIEYIKNPEAREKLEEILTAEKKQLENDNATSDPYYGILNKYF